MMRRPLKQNNRGVVLVAGLLFLAIVTVVAVSFLVIVRQEGTASVNASYSEQARLAARAGLAQAISAIESVKAQGILFSQDPNILEVGLGPLDGRVLYDGTLVDKVGEKVGDPDYLSEQFSWQDPFVPQTGLPDLPISNATKWIDPYGGQIFGPSLNPQPNGLSGFRYDLPAPPPPPAPSPRPVAHYAVRVVDLDGRLHVYPGNFGAEGWVSAAEWDTVTAVLEQEEGLDSLSIQQWDKLRDFTAGTGSWIKNPGEISLVTVTQPTEPRITDRVLRNKIHDLFTVYPADDPATFAATRPAVNINSARKSVLHALLVRIPGFAGAPDREAVVLHLIGNRPFSGRQHLEAVLADLAPAPIGDGTLSEKQFNDLLNSLNKSEPSLFEWGGDFNYNFININAPTPGLYAFNFDLPVTAPSESVPPSVLVVSNGAIPIKRGDATKDDTNVTWLTEVKFLSRFYHIIAVGQALDSTLVVPVLDDKGEPLPLLDDNGDPVLDANGEEVMQMEGLPRATRRIQAVYDIGVPELDANGIPVVDANGNPVMIVNPGIRYYRNNLTEYGNLGDLGP